MSKNFVERIGKIGSVKKSKESLSSFTNNNIPILGTIDLMISVANLDAGHKFFVTNLLDTEFLIGIDFLVEKEIDLNFSSKNLRTRYGNCSLFNRPKVVTKVMKIRCSKTVEISPNSGQFIPGKIPIRGKAEYYGLVEPYGNTQKKTGCLIASSINNTNGRQLQLQMINPQEEKVIIYKEQLLGYFQPIDTCETLTNVNIVTDDNVQNEESADNEIHDEKSADNIPQEWSKERLFKELRIQEIETQLSSKERGELQDLVWEYRDCFSKNEFDLGCCNFYEAKIELKPDHKPSWVRSRMVPYKLQPEMNRQIGNLLKAGVIEHSKTHTNWNSPIMLVSKGTPGSGRYRFVADLRGVNKMCVKDHFELPNLNRVLDKIGNSRIFSTFDLSQSFHQVKYVEESRPIVSFTYNGQRYQFARMAMGHCDSSAKFST